MNYFYKYNIKVYFAKHSIDIYKEFELMQKTQEVMWKICGNGDEMKKNAIVSFVVVLGGMYLLSAIILAVLAGILWKMDANSRMVSGAVIVVYVMVNFLGGFLIGWIQGKQKLLWGCLLGGCYFGILILAGVWVMGTELSGNSWIFSGAMICAVTGMLGGMLAPARKIARSES